MELTMTRRLVTGMMAVVLAVSLMPIATPQIASAAEIQSASMSAQSTSNTNSYNAATLTSGVSVMGEFDYATGTTTLEEYWYKFKTSGRRSAYELRLDSVDGKDMRVYSFDGYLKSYRWGDMPYFNEIAWYSPTTTSAVHFATDADRDGWYYLMVKGSTRTGRYAQYKITVTEHPIILKPNVEVVGKTNNSLTVSWARQENATNYQVEYCASDNNWVSKGVTGNSTTLESLKANATYQVRVRAYCAGGYSVSDKRSSDWGAWSDTVTASVSPTLAKVTGLKKASVSRTSMKVSWAKQAVATKYQVKYRVKGGKWKTKTAANNSISLKKLKKNKRYQVKVRAYCAGAYYNGKATNWSGWSNVKTIKTRK